MIPDDAIEALLPAKVLIRVIATTQDGARHTVEVENPLGHPDNPMQDRHIERKIYGVGGTGAGQRSQPHCAGKLVARKDAQHIGALYESGRHSACVVNVR